MHSQSTLTNVFLKLAGQSSEWILWLLVLTGLALTVLLIERAALYLRTRIDAPRLARDLVPLLSAGQVDAARRRLGRGLAMEERVLSDALEVFGRGRFAVEQILLSSAARERQRFERYLGLVGTVGSNAPFVGLLGTVIGIISAFRALSSDPHGGLAVVGPAIAEALVATAVGLLVAIPAVGAYNFFKGLLRERLANVDFLGRIVLGHIEAAPRSEKGGE